MAIKAHLNQEKRFQFLKRRLLFYKNIFEKLKKAFLKVKILKGW